MMIVTFRRGIWLGGTIASLIIAGAANPAPAAPAGVNCNATPDDPHCVRSLPLQWCALEGSGAADNPASQGDSTTSMVLWRRHERPSDSIYLPRANITLRSGLDQAARMDLFPIIRAADLDAAGVPADSPLRNGDVDRTDSGMVQTLVNLCTDKWTNEVAPQFPNRSVAGVPAINVRRLLPGICDGSDPPTTCTTDADCDPGRICLRPLGWGAFQLSDPGNTGFADDVDIPERFAPDYFLIADLSEFWQVLSTDLHHACATEQGRNKGWGTVVGHEIGHTLGLGDNTGADGQIGNDDDPDNLMSVGQCSRNLGVSIRDLLFTGAGSFPRTIADQVDWLKRASRGTWPGSHWDPAGVLIPGNFQSFPRTDPLGDVPEPAVDIAKLTVYEYADTGFAGYSFALNALAPPAGPLHYWVLVDVDTNKTTGGTAADLAPLGVPPSGFDGAEFAARITVSPGLLLDPTVWFWDGTAYVQSSNEFIGAFRRVEGFHVDTPALFDHLAIELPASVRGPVAATFRVHGISHNPATNVVDQLELGPDIDNDGVADVGQLVSLVPPQFPACGATPAQAARGQTVQLDITGLRPNMGVHVNFGGDDLAFGTTDVTGAASIPFTVPGDAGPGAHLLTAGNIDTAFTADCALEVIDVVSCQQDSDCLPGEFCQSEWSVCSQDGFCAARPVDCPDETIPVCGCDGITYRNECEAAAAGVSIAFGGPCGVQTVDIDIKPGSDPNRINPGNNGVIPVAILGSASFDVTGIDRTTLAFGPGGAAPAHGALGHLQDVNHDGFMDLLSHYPTRDTGIAPGDTQACVTGTTIVGQPFEGCDSVSAVPPGATSAGSRGCGDGSRFALLAVFLGSLVAVRRRRRGCEFSGSGADRVQL